VAVIPGVNQGHRLAAIFQNRSPQIISDSIPPQTVSKNAATNETPNDVMGETESYVLPAYNSLHQPDESFFEEDDTVELTENCGGIHGDADSGREECGEDDDIAETSQFIPTLVMDAFRSHIDYLKKLTTGHGKSAKYQVYDTLQSFWLPKSDPFFALHQLHLFPEKLLVPHFFFWDPLILVDHISCPIVLSNGVSCTGKLVHHGYCTIPRRIIDIDDSFYMITVRYRCNQCRPVHTFSSCSPLVMNKLPKPLFAQFPAYLTKRSGLSKQVFGIMRCCFQNSLGGKQFADSLNVLHRQKHESLEVQYLHTVLSRGTGKFKPFPSYETGPTAAPSGQYCRDIYDREIERLERKFDQHTAMLSSRGIAIDHSHKVKLYSD